MAGQLGADVLPLPHACHHQTCGNRNDQCGYLRHQTITNGQQHVSRASIGKGHVVLHHTHRETANDVDDQNHDAGHGIATHKLAGTVHGTKELRFLTDFCTPLAGFVFSDQAGIQIRINCHLLAGHGIQCETRRHFSNSASTFGDYDKVDQHQNDEHHNTNCKVAADQEVTKCFNHFACGIGAFVTMHKHHTG